MADIILRFSLAVSTSTQGGTSCQSKEQTHRHAGRIWTRGLWYPWSNSLQTTSWFWGILGLTVSAFSDSSGHFADWICRSGIAPCDVSAGTIEQFARHQCLCPGGRRLHRVSTSYVSRVRRFVDFLAENGVIPVSAPPAAGPPMQPRAVEFLEWLRHHRGLSEPDNQTSGPRSEKVVADAWRRSWDIRCRSCSPHYR